MSAHITDQELAVKLKNIDEVIFDSRFHFLNEHNGIRKGLLHTLLGTPSSGKSTLARSIMIDCAYSADVFVWASEESVEDYCVQLNKITRDKQILNNIHVKSETDVPMDIKNNLERFLCDFENTAIAYAPSIIFIDNITTSKMYSDSIRPEGQEKTADRLRKLALKMNIPIFMVAHTQKNIIESSSHLIDITDIRGSAAIANTSAYAYVVQNFTAGVYRSPIITIKKHRYHQIKNKYFMGVFENGIYQKDKIIDFKTMNDCFNGRDKLGEAKK